MTPPAFPRLLPAALLGSGLVACAAGLLAKRARAAVGLLALADRLPLAELGQRGRHLPWCAPRWQAADPGGGGAGDAQWWRIPDNARR